MSRVATPPQAQPASTPQQQMKIPHEKIAMRAYEKWVQRGRQQGTQLAVARINCVVGDTFRAVHLFLSHAFRVC